MNPIEDPGFPQRIERIESLIQAIEQSADAHVVADARELMQAVLDLHGAGLSRIVEAVAGSGEAGRAMLDALAADELVGNLLLLHGLHPADLETRVQAALDTVRPSLQAHGGEVELLGVEGGVVRLRMQGSCHGCPSSSLTLRNLIEEAINAAVPDAASIQVEGVVESPAASSPPPPSGVIPVEQLLGGVALARTGPDGRAAMGPAR